MTPRLLAVAAASAPRVAQQARADLALRRLIAAVPLSIPGDAPLAAPSLGPLGGALSFCDRGAHHHRAVSGIEKLR